MATDSDVRWAFFWGVVIGAFVSCVPAVHLTVEYHQDQAVAVGAAHYDTQTGEWQWNQEDGDDERTPEE